MSNHYKPSLITRLKQWYYDKFVPYITIQQSNEHFFISRKLWERIIKDIPEGQRNNMKVWFKKYTTEKGNIEYLMVVNPDFNAEYDDAVMHEIHDAVMEQKAFDEKMKDKPRSVQIVENIKRTNNASKGRTKIPFCASIQYNMYGHIGFQGIQPSPAEIVYEYDLDRKIEKKYNISLELTDRISLMVKPVSYRPEVYGERKAYIITNVILHKPIPTFAKPFAERKCELAARRRALQRARGVQYRKKV